MDITYHYPPELFELLVDGIPLLFRSKKAVLDFFKGAGVQGAFLKDLEDQVLRNKNSIHKSEIVRTVLTQLNQRGEVSLRERREILKRVVEFENFSTCWPADEYKAKGIVSDIQRVVNVKDSFTRMKQELEKEKEKHQAEQQARIQELQRKNIELEKIKSDLYSLFSIPDDQSQKRGKLLESVINRLFNFAGILVREAFELVKEPGEGILEQIDGVIEIDGYIYLVEMKWRKEPLGRQEVAVHLVNVFTRGQAGGIIISNSGFTNPAVETCKEALTQKPFVLCELEEIVMLIEQKYDLTIFLKAKIRAAIIDKNPLTYPLRDK